MKQTILLFTAFLFSTMLLAQSNQGISHQAIIRDSENMPIIESAIGVRISIIQGEIDGEIVYAETHAPVSNEHGLITFEIGTGETLIGRFHGINWIYGPYFIKTEADPTGDDDYTISGITQLLSVPYAYHASSLTLTSTNGAKYGIGVDNDGNLFSYMVEESPCPAVTDADGNTYETAWINEQCWMAENLKTTKYRDGTAIAYPGANNTTWENNTTGAYAWYDNQIANKDFYGALYNWYAVNNTKGLCPEGWRVPSLDDWDALQDYISGEDHLKGNKLKSCRQVNSPIGGDCDTSLHPRWNTHGTHYGTDEYGFSALPGGSRISNGNYQQLGGFGWWQTSTEISGNIYGKWLSNISGGLGQQPNIQKNRGMSVRCIKE